MIKKLALTLAFVMTFSVCSAANPSSELTGDEPLRLMRRPDIHGDRVVFSYQGDLWMVNREGGTAIRMTSHMGTEDFPKFSPDGRWIAFRGDYNERRGGLFVMPAHGGPPRQLTYHTNSSIPICWTNDSKYVIFSSTRESFVGFFRKFFKVPVDGGLPVALGVGKASFASYSPDGKKLAYNRHLERFWWWKRYKGSMNHDIWIYSFEDETFEKLTDYEGNDSWPMWVEGKIYFVSDRNGEVRNLYVLDLNTENIEQLTDFEDHGIVWPSLSGERKEIVFERDHRLYVHQIGTGETEEVVVRAPLNDRVNAISYVDPAKYLRSFDVSPRGKRLVYQARGEILTAPVEHGDVRNLTQSSGSRDKWPAWSPDGDWIAFISDRTGDDEVYLADHMGKEETQKLTSSGHFKEKPLWSPDGEKLLFVNEANQLYMMDVDDKRSKLICKNEHRDITSCHWSPDSRWIAYDFARRNRSRDIFIYDTREDEHHRVTDNLADDTEPYFTPDGKYLLLITEKYRGIKTLARISLLPEEEEPFKHKPDEAVGVDEEEEDEEDEKDKKKKKKKDKEEVEVKIDFTEIAERMRRIPKTGGRGMRNVQATDRYYYYQIESSKMFFFRASYDLWMFDVKKVDSKKIASAISAYMITPDKEKLAYYDGKFHIIKAGSKASKKSSDDDDNGKGVIAVKDRIEMKLDRRAEWRQIFNEGWRVVKYHFYDPNLHGVDWDGIRDYYGSLLPYVRTRRELNILMTEMVGELNASHQGVSRGEEQEEAPRVHMGFLGAKMVLDEDSGYPRIARIYESDNLSVSRYRSPLDASYVKVEEGDYLLAIDGRELEPGENLYKYLQGKTDNRITITTNDKPTMRGAIETSIEPMRYDVTLQYMDWVNSNSEFVEEASNGRIGYMHLKNMTGSGWIEFKDKFDRFRYKDGIIIDVRYNGGGNIDTRIIDYLERKPYQIQRSRGESPITRPHDVFDGEVVVLINEYSFSDAEVFPSAVKERGLGTLVGVPTLGFVIAVTGHPLIDGGYIRKTFIGIWEKSTGEMLEGKGAQPDIYVESPPGMEKKGRDIQLEKGVEVLMEKMGEPRDFEYELETPER